MKPRARKLRVFTAIFKQNYDLWPRLPRITPKSNILTECSSILNHVDALLADPNINMLPPPPGLKARGVFAPLASQAAKLLGGRPP